MVEQPPYTDRLRAELVQAADRRNRRRDHRFAIVRVVVIALLVLTPAFTVLTLWQQPSRADVLQVEKAGSDTVVTLQQANATLQQVTKELRAAHIPVTVKAVPVADPAVGKFVTIASSGDHFVQPVQVQDNTFRQFRISADTKASVQLLFGRKAHRGEQFAWSYDAYAQGGPLHCSGTWGKTVAEDLPLLQRAGKTIVWLQFDPGSGITPTTAAASSANYVVKVSLSAPNHLVIIVSATANNPYLQDNKDSPDCP